MSNEVRVAKETNTEKIKVHYTNKKGIEKLTNVLINTLSKVSKNTSIVLVCIGTDRSTGDSLAPIVGTFLQKSKFFNKNIFLYGNVHEPVHATNLSETIDKISKEHPKSFIIAIDACLGKHENVGNINFSNEPLKPGSGVGKDLPYIGNCHISANVNVGGFMEYHVLQNTRLSIVFNQAEIITKIIKNAYIKSYDLRTDEKLNEKVVILNGLKKQNIINKEGDNKKLVDTNVIKAYKI